MSSSEEEDSTTSLASKEILKTIENDKEKNSSKEDETESKHTAFRWWKVVALMLIAMTVFLLIAVVIPPLLHLFVSPEAYLSAFLVIGVVSLISALAFLVIILKSLNLTDPKGTLGLPEGSIRAVIALSLILIFMKVPYSFIRKPKLYKQLRILEFRKNS